MKGNVWPSDFYDIKQCKKKDKRTLAIETDAKTDTHGETSYIS